jgi:hypothetical protein
MTTVSLRRRAVASAVAVESDSIVASESPRKMRLLTQTVRQSTMTNDEPAASSAPARSKGSSIVGHSGRSARWRATSPRT